MKNIQRKGLILAVILGIVLLLGNQAPGMTLLDPEIRDLSGSIIVRGYEGREEFSLQFVYLNDQSMKYLWDSELVEETKKLIGDRNCLFLMVFVYHDSYFYPTAITFVQEPLQYEIGYDDVVKTSDTFSGHLRAGVKVFGFIFIPEDIDVYSPMKIYYDDDWTTFSVPKEELKKPDVGHWIKTLERERIDLEKKIIEIKKRIDEIDRELDELRKRREK